MPAFVIRRAPHRRFDEHLAWIHQETAHNPQAWYYSAETLFESAECLKNAMSGRAARLLRTKGYMDSHYASYGMLLGYALECIFKGLWVTNGRTLVKNGKLTGIEGANDHDLSQLAHAVGVRFVSQKEKGSSTGCRILLESPADTRSPRLLRKWLREGFRAVARSIRDSSAPRIGRSPRGQPCVCSRS